jgi:HEAT repeat protein/protein-S-isoprenylcysteine O-methyltransferase Ste14
MKTGTKQFLFLALLAGIFTAGLTFTSVELPHLLDTFLDKTINKVDVVTGQNEMSIYKTELYLQYYNLRLIGYGCLALIVILICVGFITGKSGWTSAGAMFLFLPVFGHFAATMFFLGGLGILRLIWLPFLDISFSVFRLGEIVVLPYKVFEHLHLLLGLNRWIELYYIIIGTGLLIFFLGTLTWFHARLNKISIADFWIYRYSRHPQYLGWIIWSYGVMFMPAPNIRQSYELSNSMPWLLSAMIIISVAMLEELKMKKNQGELYESYCKGAPFLFPLPRIISKMFTLPQKLIFKTEYPNRRREIFVIVLSYTLFLLAASVFYGGFVKLPERKADMSAHHVEKLARVLRDAESFREKRLAAVELEKIGNAAVGPLIALLNDKEPNVRAYSAEALGGIGSEEVVKPLMALLRDSDSYVRKIVVGALGRTSSQHAIQPLAEAIWDQKLNIANVAVLALGNIKLPEVVPILMKALQDTTINVTWSAASALGDLGAKEAIDPIIRCYNKSSDCPYNLVGEVLWKLNSDRAVDVWITGLRRGSWWYYRASCATSLGKNKLEKGIGSLQEALKDSSAEVRRAAVIALMEFRSEKTIDAMRAALDDKDFEVRMYAEEALKKIRTSGMKESTPE